MTTPLIHRYSDVPDPHALELGPEQSGHQPLLTVMVGGVVGVLCNWVMRDSDGTLQVDQFVKLDGLEPLDTFGGRTDKELAELLADSAAVLAVLAEELSSRSG